MPTYTKFATGAAVSGTGQLNVPMPAGDLTGKLLLLVLAHRNAAGNTVTEAPADYLPLSGDSSDTTEGRTVWGRIGTGTDPSVTVNMGGSTYRVAWVEAWDSDTGWPAIGSVLVGTPAVGQSTVTGIRYRSATAAAGLLAVRLASKPIDSGGAITAVAVTTGWTAGQWEYGGAFTSIVATEWRTTDGNVAESDVATTGNTESRLVHGITLLFEGNPESGASLDNSTPTTGNTVVATAGVAFANPIATMTWPSGDVINAEAGATTTVGGFIIPALSEFSAGGQMSRTRFGQQYQVSISDGTTSVTVPITILPPAGTLVRDLAVSYGEMPADALAYGAGTLLEDALAGDQLRARATSGTIDYFTDTAAIGLDGASAIVEFVLFNSGFWRTAFTRTFNPVASVEWQPNTNPTDLTFQFRRSGEVIATHVVRCTLNIADRTVSAATLSRDPDGEDAVTSLVVEGQNTQLAVVRVTHESGANGAQTVLVLERGVPGPAGPPGDGANGPRALVGMVYYQLESEAAPETPSATAFDFATGQFVELSANWGTSPPTFVASNPNRYWYSYFRVVELAFGGGQTIEFLDPQTALNFTGIVTFTGDGVITDGNNELSFGSSGTTSINGGNIIAGTITLTAMGAGVLPGGALADQDTVDYASQVTGGAKPANNATNNGNTMNSSGNIAGSVTVLSGGLIDCGFVRIDGANGRIIIRDS